MNIKGAEGGIKKLKNKNKKYLNEIKGCGGWEIQNSFKLYLLLFLILNLICTNIFY
jgi:hypothetical protein